MDQIEEVRGKIDIVALISESVPLKKAGRNFRALCPFHEEKTPSFMVSQERQMWKCFGCGLGGDVFKFLMLKENMEFGEALRYLADKAGVELKDFRPSLDQKRKERLLSANHLASEYYHFLLTQHPTGKKALEYLLKRGVSKSSIQLFKLGFAPNEWEGLSRFLVGKKGYKPEELETAGLVIKGDKGFYDRFRDRVIFSLFDHRGRVVGFSGRVLDPAAKEAKYINSPETLLYHKSAVLYGLETTKETIKKADRAVVVEGELDLIASYQAGVKNVVAIKGSALTEEQIELLKRFTQNLSLALDEDLAGDQAVRRGIELADKSGLNIRVIRVKYGKDPDECVRKSASLWKESVKAAVPIYDFYLDSAVRRFGTETIEAKRKISEELAAVLAKVDNQVIKAHYIKKLAELLAVDEEAVALEVERKGRVSQAGDKAAEPLERQTTMTRQERLEEYLLALLLQAEEETEEGLELVEEKWLSRGAVKKIVIKLKEWVKQGKQLTINQLAENLPAELVGKLDEAYLTDLGKVAEDKDKLIKEIKKLTGELKKLALKARLGRLSSQIKAAEEKKETINTSQLQREAAEIARQLKG